MDQKNPYLAGYKSGKRKLITVIVLVVAVIALAKLFPEKTRGVDDGIQAKIESAVRVELSYIDPYAVNLEFDRAEYNTETKNYAIQYTYQVSKYGVVENKKFIAILNHDIEWQGCMAQ